MTINYGNFVGKSSLSHTFTVIDMVHHCYYSYFSPCAAIKAGDGFCKKSELKYDIYSKK